MDKPMTLGSLFDGSGGFPLGAIITGIEPLWASEVEPFPIRVTTKRLPFVKHYGDINKINGADIPPVDIITAGFCCQDLSVAGKRAGLQGERSGLFYQIPRIIKEMLAATDGEYPKYAVLENVPGMYSSGGGADFMEVLNELIHIKDETVSVPMPEKGKWSTSGEVVGDGFSIGWRTLDAQFWGVAQRRRRCYIVIDFTGERAGQVLFDETRLRGNPPPSSFPWQGAAGNIADGSGGSVCVINDQGGKYMDISEDVTGTLRAQEHGHSPVVFEPGAMLRIGGHCWQDEPTGALRADMGDNQLAVAVENHPNDSRVKIDESGTVQALTGRMGTGGGNVPLVMNERQYALTVGEDVANTLTGTDYKGTQCVFEPMTFDVRQTSDGTINARTHAYETETSRSLDTGQGVPGTNHGGVAVVEAKVFGICSKNSNSMKSNNPHSGIYEAETSRTLDTSVPDPNKNAGGIAVVALEGNGSRPSHRGDGYGGDVSFTLNSVERHSVCYQDKVSALTTELAHNTGTHGQHGGQLVVEKEHVCYQDRIGALCASDYKFPQNMQVDQDKAIVERVAIDNYQHSGYRETDVSGTLKEHGGTNGGGSEGLIVENRYVVRRLTPSECALLQGFPPGWCAGLETPEPTEEDIDFWSEVWETHRIITGTSSKPKTRKQIVKWLRDPHSDAAEYKMWGNGVALPCVVFVLGGIANQSR